MLQDRRGQGGENLESGPCAKVHWWGRVRQMPVRAAREKGLSPHFRRPAQNESPQRRVGRAWAARRAVNDYFCRRSLWRISGQNSLTILLRTAASIPIPQFTAVLCQPRSTGG